MLILWSIFVLDNQDFCDKNASLDDNASVPFPARVQIAFASCDLSAGNIDDFYEKVIDIS